MSLTLVLVRHGQAQNKRLGQTDFDRELTEAGRKALSDAFPKTFAQLADADDVQLWVSPAVRAQQTAAEVVAAVNAELAEALTLDCLYEQDADAFLTQLAGRLPQGGTVVAVGHVPFMEDLALYLCGYDLPFAPGAALAVELGDKIVDDGTGRPPARLLWYVQGPRVR